MLSLLCRIIHYYLIRIQDQTFKVLDYREYQLLVQLYIANIIHKLEKP